jgi:hypothetical protein
VTAAIALFGLLIFGIGAVGSIRPRTLLEWIQRTWASGAALPVAVVFRTAFGILLISAATETRFPTFVSIIGFLSLVSAATAIFVGRAGAQRFVDWWLEQSAGFVRGWSALACAFGAFLIYAVT